MPHGGEQEGNGLIINMVIRVPVNGMRSINSSHICRRSAKGPTSPVSEHFTDSANQEAMPSGRLPLQYYHSRQT